MASAFVAAAEGLQVPSKVAVMPSLPNALASPLVSQEQLGVLDLVRQQDIETVVVSCVDDGKVAGRIAPLVKRVIDIGPPAHARASGSQGGSCTVELLSGMSHRVIADIRPTLRGKCLFLLSARNGAVRRVQDEIFHVPRGSGVIAIYLDVEAGGSPNVYDQIQDQLIRWSPNHRAHVVAGDDGQSMLLVFPQRLLHVTFLIEKYAHEYENSGLSINLDNLVATLHQTGLATYDVIHYDERFHTGQGIHLSEFEKPSMVDEHLLVCTCHYHSPSNPDVEMLRRAKDSGTKIAFVWLDKMTSMKTPVYAAVADVNVVLDGNDFDLPNHWPVFTPKNPIYYNDPGLERDVDFSIIGESRHLQQRKDFIRLLKTETRIAPTIFQTSAADTKASLSLEEYTSIFKRSKISLVLTKDRVRQLKGRIFEVIHCGAMLICDMNPYINTYFEPGVDYVPFRDYEDMVAKVAYYLEHEGERAAIAKSGHAKVVKYYNHQVFWRSLLARCGMTTSEL